ncbi:MAG: class I SAM-dependent methyltransferase [Parvularculaceae bacterium]|nr:class I SAM-dependent methyltransferase [Parvularculaceae bacterium]
MTDNSQIFGTQPDRYRQGRHGYPDELFEWIANQAPDRTCAWDVATGSGQAAVPLAQRFERVVATDLSEGQIAAAQAADGVEYRVAPAETSGLPDGLASAITVATALHWFDFERFWPEVRRVGKPGAVFCGFTVKLPQADPEVTEHLLRPVWDRIDPYWAEGNRLSMRGYLDDDIHCPFERIKTPDMELVLDWTPTRLLALVHSWSASMKARDDGHAEALDAIESNALKLLGEGSRRIVLPMTVVTARVG